jgi:hypothetical protein
MKYNRLSSIVLFFILILGSITNNELHAQGILNNYPQTNGRIFATAKRNDTIFIGGNFTSIYNSDSIASYGSIMNPYTGKPSAKWDQPDGEVFAALPDKKGGFFVGGNFQKIGPKKAIRFGHIDSTGNKSDLLNQSNVNGVVKAMVNLGDTLLIGGQFNLVGNFVETSGVPVFSRTNSVSENFPTINGEVWSVIPDGTGGWYIGGNFSSVGGVTRNNAARIDGNGNLLAWNPNINGHVYAMQIYNNKVYMGGSFSQLNSTVRSGLAAVDTASGAVSAWNPGSPSTVIRAIVVSNNTLFVAGAFLDMAAQTRKNIAAFSLPSESLTSFSATMTSTGASLYSLAVVGNKVFIGGLFTLVNGDPRNNIACLDAQTGSTVSTWQANANGGVNSILYANNHIYIGGTFNNVKGLSRTYLAAVDTATGSVNTFSPSLNGAVQCMALGIANSYLYVSGNFSNFYRCYLLTNHTLETWPLKSTNYANAMSVVGARTFVGGTISSIGGETRTNLAAFSMRSGELLSWSPSTDGRVETICNVKDSFLFLGGYFSQVNGINRSSLAIFNRSGALHNIAFTFNGNVRSIAFGGDSIVYVGGSFTNVATISPYNSLLRVCSKITAINFRTGRVQPTYNPNANNDVYTLMVDGNTLYAGGIFTSIGGQPRQFVAGISRNTALANSFNPGLFSGSTSVNTICRVDSNLLIGGNFYYTVNSINIRRNLAAFNIGTSILSKLANEPDLPVNCLVKNNETIYCGGNFTLLGAMGRNNVAAFLASNGNILNFDIGTSTNFGNHSVFCMFWKDDYLFLGGTFDMIGEVYRNKFGVIHVPSQTVHSFDPNPISTGVIYSVFVQENLLFIGGQFTNIASTTRNRLAVFNYPSFTLNSANPNFSGWPLSYATINPIKIVMGGSWTTIGGVTAANFAAFNLPAVSRITTTPVFNSNGVSMVKFVNNQVFVCGNFTTIGGISKPNFAILDSGTLNPTSFTSTNAGGVSCFAVSPGNNVYMGGNFTMIGGQARSIFASLNVNTGLANSFYPIISNPAPNTANVRSIELHENKVFVFGQFDKVNNRTKNNILVFYDLDTMVSITSLTPNGNACKGASVTINYTVNKSFNASNQFVVELVDSGLPNKAPIQMAVLNQNTSGSIQTIIPFNVTEGRTYYVQIRATSPNTVSAWSIQTIKPINCSPTIGSSNLIFSAITQNSATLSWTKGNGTSCIVIGRFGSAVNALPQNGRSYLGNAAFGLGDTIGGGNFVLYVGTANSVNISLLNQLSNYHFAVIEFNGNNTSADYLNSQTLYGNMNTLPVAWLSFNGDRLNASEIQLNWTTAQEINNNYFNVERKIGEQSEWITIAKVNGSGNSFSNRKYRYLDVLSEANKTDKHLFYRLKQVDFDGKYSYSKTIQLAIDLSETLMIIPNPFIQSFTVNQGLNKIIAYKIFNSTGELVQAENVNSTFLTIDGTTFKQGMYIIEVQTISSKIVRKIVKM